MFLSVVMILGILPMSAFAAPAADVPESMRDNAILRALQYTGYNVQKQKDNGTLYQKGYYASSLATELVENKYEPQEVRRVTVVSGQTATFENSALCASFNGYRFHVFDDRFCRRRCGNCN